MRLRQIALATSDLDAVTKALEDVFGLRVAFRDPHIIHYGLKNAVLPVGSAFIEALQPVHPDASAARFLAKRGDDAGYMLIFQAPDAAAERARVAALGVRVVDDIDRPDYRASHFHPADFGGVLTSIDEQRTAADYLEPLGDWWPAGPDWRAALGEDVRGLVAVTLSSPDPAALAERWSTLLNAPLDSGDRLRLPLAKGELRFVHGDEPGTRFHGVELKLARPADALGRARAAGFDVDDEGVLIAGVRFMVVS